MPAAPGKASMRTRLTCIGLLSVAAVMASVFVGTPLAAALHVLLYPFLLDAAVAATIITEVGLTVAYVILRTEGRTG